jgi:predicted metal-dependent HD superfamily phosphohydrolase
LGADPVPDIGLLFARLDEPHRHYHGRPHVRHCLSVYDQGPVRDDAIELALWLHDAIYDPHARDNEERSAVWCVELGRSAGITTDLITRTERCILATRHRHVPIVEDECLTVSIDLAILGETPERFRTYDHQIRREYAWVPMETYRRERARVLRGFLDRPAIYPHPWWERRCGRQARINLRRAVQTLGVHGPGTTATSGH